jgi:chromosome segregation ATPase
LAEEGFRELIQVEQDRCQRAHLELGVLEAKAVVFRRWRSNSLEASSQLQEQLHRLKLAQLETKHLDSEIEAIEHRRQGLDTETWLLDADIRRAEEALCHRDRELQVKGNELQETRRCFAELQEELDEANADIREQCEQVGKLEESLRISQDYVKHTEVLRGLLGESDSAILHICSVLERERGAHAQEFEDLQQQKLRTELIVQLVQQYEKSERGCPRGPVALGMLRAAATEPVLPAVSACDRGLFQNPLRAAGAGLGPPLVMTA